MNKFFWENVVNFFFLSWNDLVLAHLDKQKLIAIEFSWWIPFRISLGFEDNKKRKQRVNDWARKDKILKATVDEVGEKEINFKIFVWWLCFNVHFILTLSKASRDHLMKAFAKMKTLSQPET